RRDHPTPHDQRLGLARERTYPNSRSLLMTRLSPWIVCACLLLALGGCRETVDCPEGQRLDDDGRCIPDQPDSGPLPDAGDAGPDVDAETPDAGPCGACDGHCIDGRCVECTPEPDATDCSEEGKPVRPATTSLRR